MYKYGSLKPGFIPESFDGAVLVATNVMGPATAQAFAGPRFVKYTVAGPLIGALVEVSSYQSNKVARIASAPRSVDK
jgi:hypothetical protein